MACEVSLQEGTTSSNRCVKLLVDTETGNLYYRDGSNFVLVTGGGGGPDTNITTGVVAPATANRTIDFDNFNLTFQDVTTFTVGGDLELTAQNELRFQDAAGGQYSGFKAAATVGTSHTYTLPDALPASNKFLQSTAAGIMTWETPAGSGTDTNITTGIVAAATADRTIDFDNFNLTFQDVTTFTVGGDLSLTAQHELRFQDTTGGQYTAFKAAGTVASSHTYTLPDAFPVSNKFLQSTAAGLLTWETVASGTDTNITTGTVAAATADRSIDFDNFNLTFVDVTAFTVGGNLELTAQHELRFQDAAGGEYAGFKAPATIGISHTYELPNAFPGSNKFLQSTAAGILTWETIGAGGDTNFAISDLTATGDRVHDFSSTNSLFLQAVDEFKVTCTTGVLTSSNSWNVTHQGTGSGLIINNAFPAANPGRAKWGNGATDFITVQAPVSDISYVLKWFTDLPGAGLTLMVTLDEFGQLATDTIPAGGTDTNITTGTVAAATADRTIDFDNFKCTLLDVDLRVGKTTEGFSAFYWTYTGADYNSVFRYSTTGATTDGESAVVYVEGNVNVTTNVTDLYDGLKVIQQADGNGNFGAINAVYAEVYHEGNGAGDATGGTFGSNSASTANVDVYGAYAYTNKSAGTSGENEGLCIETNTSGTAGAAEISSIHAKTSCTGSGTHTNAYLAKLEQITGSPTNAFGIWIGPTLQGTNVWSIYTLVGTVRFGDSLTGSQSRSLVDLVETWNTSGNPTLIKAEVTNTASGSSSLLMDLRVDAVSQFKVDKAGAVTSGAVTSTGVSSFTPAANNTIPLTVKAHASQSVNTFVVEANAGTDWFTISSSGVVTSQLKMTCTNTNIATIPLNVIAAASQSADIFVVENSGGTDYFKVSAAGQSAIAGLSLTGSQATNSLDITGTWNTTGNPTLIFGNITNTASGATANLIDLQASTVSKFKVDKTGAATFGGAGTFAGSVSIANDSLVSNSQGNLLLGSTSSGVRAIGNIVLTMDSDNNTTNGLIRFLKDNNTVASATEVMAIGENGLLSFGGQTTSFPALKASSTVLQARLADDSDFAPLQGKLRAHANAVSETPTATHTIIIHDATGTAYRVLALV